jgi:hypothetical protein
MSKDKDTLESVSPDLKDQPRRSSDRDLESLSFVDQPQPRHDRESDEMEDFYSKRILVDGQYIVRGEHDEELNVRDFYLNPTQIRLLMELLHSYDDDFAIFPPVRDMENDSTVNDLYQELYTQVVYHPDKFYEANQPKLVVDE